jgi:hypothetical protein
MQIGHLMFELHAFLLFQVDDLEIDLEDERISQSFLVEGGLKNHTQIKKRSSKSDHSFSSYLHFCTFLADDLESDLQGQRILWLSFPQIVTDIQIDIRPGRSQYMQNVF